MDLRLYRALVAVADASSFSRAAETLSITQPALTKQIQQLEAFIGAPVFIRGRSGAELTALGELLLPSARELVERADQLEAQARRIAAGDVGQLRIGFGLSTLTIAPRAVARFRRDHPDVRVVLDDMSSAVQAERIERGLLDVGFMRLPAPAPLDSVSLETDTLAVASPAGWDPPEDAAGMVPWLDAHPVIALAEDRGPGLSAQVRRYFAESGSSPAPAQYARDIQTVLALVAAGAGVGVVPYSARRIAPQGITFQPIRAAASSWHVGVVWHPGRVTPVIRKFLEGVAANAPAGSPRRSTS